MLQVCRPRTALTHSGCSSAHAYLIRSTSQIEPCCMDVYISWAPRLLVEARQWLIKIEIRPCRRPDFSALCTLQNKFLYFFTFYVVNLRTLTMGNCGSSLDCTKCYSAVPIEGCETELKINADIAGIGVSAFSLPCILY